MCVFFSEIFPFESHFSHLYNDEAGFLVTAVNFLGSGQRLDAWEDTQGPSYFCFLQLTLHRIRRWRIEQKIEVKKQVLGMAGSPAGGT